MTCYSSRAFMLYRFRSCALKTLVGVSRTKFRTKRLERTDRQTDRQTDKVKTISLVRGIIMELYHCKLIVNMQSMINSKNFQLCRDVTTCDIYKAQS